MSEEEIQDQPQYHPLDKQIHQINNNHQEKESDQQNHDQEDSPFEQLDQILGPEDDHLNKKESFQTENFQQLESRCRNLQKQNSELLKRIQQLQSQVEWQNQTQEDIEKVIQFIQLMQSQISNYKNQFQQFKNNHTSRTKLKQQIINQFKHKIAELTQQNHIFQQQCSNLSQSNQQLLTINEGLIDQIQNLSKQLKKNRSQANSTKSFYFQDKRYTGFEGQVQAELERLIEKLVSQLEFERGQKRRSNQQMKRMQQTIIQLQRQITLKNNKIYTLQIKFLQKHKEHNKDQTQQNKQPPSQAPILKHSKSSSRLNYGRNDNHNRQTSPTNKFTVKQLISTVQANEKQRFIISSKIVDFYIKKLRNKNYSTLALQDILVCNFTKQNPNLTIIKNSLDLPPSKTQLSAQDLINNLSFIIESILGQILNAKQLKSQNEEQLIYLVYKILQENSSTLQEAYDLKKFIDEVIEEMN